MTRNIESKPRQNIILVFCHQFKSVTTVPNNTTTMSSLQKALVEEKKSSLQSALAKEMGGGKRNRQRKSPPAVTTANESDSSDDDASSSSSDDSDSDNEEMNPQMMNGTDMMKIRQQAIKLVNTPTAGPHAEAAKRKSKPFVSPYQQQSAGQGSSAALPPGVTSYQSSYQSSAPRSMHNPQSHPQARTADKLSMADMVVNCVSEVCKSSSSELISKVLSSGYRSVNNYENPPVSGSWGEIDTSSHGYGNNNRAPAFATKGGNMPARYQD